MDVKFNCDTVRINKIIRIGIYSLVLKTYFSVSLLFSSIEVLDELLTVLASLCFGVVILETKYSNRTLGLYGVIGLLGGLTVLKIGNVGFLVTIITCFAIKKENIDRVIKCIYELELVLLIFNILISLVGTLVGEMSIVTTIYGVERCNFGFTHPNTFSVILFNLILMWIYLHFDKIKLKNILCILILGAVLFYFTKTRTFLINVVGVCFLLAYSRKQTKLKELILKKTAMLVTPVIAMLTYILSFMYLKGKPIALIADQILNSRIKLAAYGIENFGITLFGENLNDFVFKWDPKWQLGSFTFDNIYSYFLSSVGLIWLVIICICFYFLAQKGDIRLCILIIAWALYGMTEVHGMDCYKLIPLLFCTNLLCDKSRRKEWSYGKYNSTNI